MEQNKEKEDSLFIKTGRGTGYPIFFEEGFENFPERLENVYGGKDKKVCIVSDDTVFGLYGEDMEGVLSKTGWKVIHFVFPAGEVNKTLDTVKNLYEFLIVNRFERRDLLLALGGGVVGDLTGYAASTYLRGIDFIQVPTTLLSQVDSSIGGKTAVDFDGYKNMVGAFHNPAMVYMNLKVLMTLSSDQFACGMGEILKHGLIKNASYYEWLIEHMMEIQEKDLPVLKTMILESCKIKKAVVEKDPLEKGDRALLNFGHTIGHAVEKVKAPSLLHGQCVALGCVAAAYISYKRGYLSTEEFFEIRDMNVGFDLMFSTEKIDRDEILKITKSDKKMDGGKIKFVLLKKLGRAFVTTDVTDDELLEAIDFIDADKRVID